MTTAHAAPAVATLAAELLDDLDALTEELVLHITEQIEFYRTGTVVKREDLRSALRSNLDHILGRLSGRRELDMEAPRRIGRSRAMQDVPLPEILRAYRLGFSFVWERMLTAARRSGRPAVDALLDTSSAIWEFADDYATAMSDAYRRTLGERLVAADRRRSGILAAILDGTPGASQDHSAWEVAKLLDLPYEGKFLVVVAEIGPGSAALMIEERLRRLDVASAWRSQPDYEVGVLALGRRRTVESVLEALGRHADGRVGVSPLFYRLDGAARAVRLAQVAMETLPVGSAGVSQLEDEPLVDLLVRDRQTTARFVERVLGRVLALPDDDRATLLATAGAWLDAHGSAAEAGRVLYCHENTVRHRIRRLEEHLGGGLDDPRNLSNLLTALHALRAFPELADSEVAP